MDLDQTIYYTGENHDYWLGSISPPIYQTSNFVFDSVEEFKEKIKDEKANYLYTRGNNPTVEVLRRKLAELEGMEDALIFSSGAAAMNAAIASQISRGGHILCVNQVYTWTKRFLTEWLPKFGIEVSFANGADTDLFLSHAKSNTQCIVLESPNSLIFELQDLEAITSFARKKGIITILDNSYATPLYQKSSQYGIDIAVHSATKYINGHGDVLGGVICSRESIIRKIFQMEYMMYGAICHPHEASLMLRGLRTLPLRLDRSNQSALYIAQILETHPKIQKVIHPLLSTHPQHDLALRQMKGCGGLFSIVLNTEDPNKCISFSNALRRFKIAASWGSYESLQMPMVAFEDYSGKSPSVPSNLVRLYIGLENPDLLLEDLLKGLEMV